MSLLILLVSFSFIQVISSNLITCYYEKDDSQLNIDNSRPQLKIINLKFNSDQNPEKGFGFWSKYIATMDFDSYSKYSRPYDVQYCYWGQCIFNGFFFLKILDENQDTIAAMILNMKDEPISLTHEIYLFAIGQNEYQYATFNYFANQYQNIWYYTSFIYSTIDKKLRIFTNFENQIHSFDYQIMTDEITVQLGGYDQQLYYNYVIEGQQLLFFKGYFSPIQEYDFVTYFDNLFTSLFSQCSIQEQNTSTLIYDYNDVIDPSPTYNNDLFLPTYTYKIVNERYLIKFWVKQDYEEAFLYYQREYQQTFYKLRQTVFLIDSLKYLFQDLQGDRVMSLYYEVDFLNNNETIISFSTEFFKIPLLVQQYQDQNLRQYDTVIINKENLFELTQSWHYVVIEYGRKSTNGNTLQLRIYFLNQETLIYNLGIDGYNSQFTGQPIIQYLQKQDNFFGKSRTKIRRMKFLTGYHEDNNDYSYECHPSCKDCFGPTNSDCKSCYTEFQYALTQFNICDCMYLTQFVANTQKCQPIENLQYLTIIQIEIDKMCKFGYFQVNFKNQIFCVQCPEYHQDRLQCGDCYNNWSTWYLKPICSFDYIQQGTGYPFIKQLRNNRNIDVYYLDDQIQLHFLQGASDFCNDTQYECQESENYHLGQQIKMKCKQNHFFSNNQCQICDIYCNQCLSKDLCIDCINGYYFNFSTKKCQLCPTECLTCKSDNSIEFGYRCLTCIKAYALTQDGKCEKCGIDCENCEEDFNSNTQLYYLRCLKCVDDKRMSVRFDGISCRLIVIENCQNVMIISKSNPQFYSNFPYNFVPSNDFDDELPICGLCEENYGYNLILEYCEPRDYDTSCSQSYFTQYLYNGILYPYQYFCLVSKIQNGVSTFGEECESQFPNCQFCMNQQQYTPLFCLECKPGYYSNRISGQCFICPESMNCKSCYHSSIKFNDQWKIKLTVINQFLKLQTNSKYFFTQDQSNNPQDYQLICTTCNSGFMLKDGLCIKYCDSNCPSCQYSDGQFHCQYCPQNNYHNQLSLIQYKCSQCPSYCEFCRERTQQELISLNSNFVPNLDNTIYSYQCLKAYSNNKILHYDQLFGQFLPCNNLDACENIITFEINLFCSNEEYQKSLQQITDTEQQLQFRMQNVVFDQLLQTNSENPSFQDLELDSKYEIMNKKFIRKIIISLTSHSNQICSVNEINYISQKFSKNSFNIIDVQLIIKSKFDQPLKIKVYKELHFLDFSYLRFENIDFEMQKSSTQDKLISVQGFKPIKLHLEKIIFSFNTFEQNNFFTFQGNQLTQTFLNGINFENITIQNDNLKSIFIFQTLPEVLIQIQNISIINCHFKNINIFEFKSLQTVLIEIDQINLTSDFNNCSLLQSNTNKEILSLSISNFYFTGQIENSEPFITLSNIQFAQIINFTMIQLKLINSIFIQLEKYVTLQNISIKQCYILGAVQIISNFLPKQLSNETKIIYNFNKLEVQDVILNYLSKILYLQPYHSASSSVELINILLSNINIDNVLNFQQDTSLIKILLQTVKIQYCTIYRGSGFIELLFENILKLKIMNLKASQLKKYQLHQYHECSNLNPDLYPSLIKLLDVQNINFEHFFITDFNIVNAALILISSYSQISYETICKLNDLLIKGSIITISQPDSSASLIQISNRQQIEITLTNLEITQNQLHNYGQNLFVYSAVGVIINCPSGILKLETSIFNNNFATNTTDTIIYIFAKNIFMDSVVFLNNSIYDVQLFLDNTIKNFPKDQLLKLTYLKSLFPIISEVGNTYLQAETVKISNCQIENSSGKNGVGFYIKAFFIKIIDVSFKNLKTYFKNNNEHGSCIFLEIASQRSQIIIQNINATNVITKDYGSILFILSNYDYLNLTLKNLVVNRCISSKGTVLYASFQKTSVSNFLNISDIVIKYQEVAFFEYIKQLVQNSKVQMNLNNRVSFYIDNSVLNLFNVIINKLFDESLLNCNDQGNIKLHKIFINHGIISKQSLLYIQPRSDLKTIIIIKELQVEGLVQSFDQGEQCQISQIIKSTKTQNMQCKVEPHIQNIEIDFENLNNQDIDCLYRNYLFTNTISQRAIIIVDQIKEQDSLQLLDSHFINNNISLSKSGIIFFQLNKQLYQTFSIAINNLKIKNNECGYLGCLCLNNGIYNSNYLFFNDTQRILQQSKEQILIQLTYDIIIKNYICVGNDADYGTCLFINSSKLLISNSILSNNRAKKAGGVIYFIGNESLLMVTNSQIMRNEAQIAGAFYFDHSISQDMKKFDTNIYENYATLYGNEIVQSPSHLSVTTNNYKSIFNIYPSYETYDALYEALNNSNNNNQVIFLPSGTSIKEYYQFNQITQELEPLHLTFRIVALDYTQSKLYNLKNSKCEIETKVYDLESKEYINVQNQKFISQNIFYFNEITSDYNLDDLIIYFDSNYTNKKYLQLVITCDSIKVKQYYQNNLIVKSVHTNYKLLVNINTFQCRVGEIKSTSDKSCHECDSKLDQYSLQINSNKCNIRDEQTTLNVISYKLNLREGFWRPYFDNNQIEECYNLKENCRGLWDYGDASCYLGHIGALCEQCDIQDTRGQGRYSNAQQYTCGSCDEIRFNLIQIIGFSIWTLLTIVLSVKGAITIELSFLESPYLIKIFTNYLQIISSLTTFKLNLPVNYFYFLEGVGSPIQRISYSMDCYLINMSQIDIHYMRLIWQLILPCIYFLILAIFYSFLIYLKYVKYRGPIVMTAIIYMYIYFQPSLIGSLIALVSTRTISGVSWIQANVAFKFDTFIHLRWSLAFCIPFLSLFGILIPSGLLFGLYKQRDKLIYKRGKSLFGYLYYEYKPKAYFWEIVKIITKELVILFLIFYEDSIIVKGTLIYFILLFYQLLNLKYQPFKSFRLNKLDYESTLICATSIILGVGLNMGQQSEVKSIYNVYFFTLVIMNIFMLVKLLIYIIYSYFYELEDLIDLLKKKLQSVLPKQLKMSNQCQRILEPQAIRRRRIQNNFKRLKSAYKQFKQKSRPSPQIYLFNTTSTLQATQRIMSQFTEREQRFSQKVLLSDALCK